MGSGGGGYGGDLGGSGAVLGNFGRYQGLIPGVSVNSGMVPGFTYTPCVPTTASLR